MEAWGFRGIILVSAAAESCIERAVVRDQISEAEVMSRLAAQIPIEQKRTRAEIIIENNGSLSELESQVDTLYSKLSP